MKWFYDFNLSLLLLWLGLWRNDCGTVACNKLDYRPETNRYRFILPY